MGYSFILENEPPNDVERPWPPTHCPCTELVETAPHIKDGLAFGTIMHDIDNKNKTYDLKEGVAKTGEG